MLLKKILLGEEDCVLEYRIWVIFLIEFVVVLDEILDMW